MAKKKSHQSGSIHLGPGLLVATAATKWHKLANAALERTDLTATQFALMCGIESLSMSSDPITQTRLSLLVGTDVMLTSKHVRILESKGLVARAHHPTDTRARSLSLTRGGTSLLKKAQKAIASLDSEFFETTGIADKVVRTLSDINVWSE